MLENQLLLFCEQSIVLYCLMPCSAWLSYVLSEIVKHVEYEYVLRWQHCKTPGVQEFYHAKTFLKMAVVDVLTITIWKPSTL